MFIEIRHAQRGLEILEHHSELNFFNFSFSFHICVQISSSVVFEPNFQVDMAEIDSFCRKLEINGHTLMNWIFVGYVKIFLLF